jgi:hypothetical protein
MEAESASETSVFLRECTERHPRRHLHTLRRGNPKSHNVRNPLTSEYRGLKDAHTDVCALTSWAVLEDYFAFSSSADVKNLLSFPCTYLCGTALPRYAATSRKYRDMLNAERVFTQINLVASKQLLPLD